MSTWIRPPWLFVSIVTTGRSDGDVVDVAAASIEVVRDPPAVVDQRVEDLPTVLRPHPTTPSVELGNHDPVDEGRADDHRDLSADERRTPEPEKHADEHPGRNGRSQRGEIPPGDAAHHFSPVLTGPLLRHRGSIGINRVEQKP